MTIKTVTQLIIAALLAGSAAVYAYETPIQVAHGRGQVELPRFRGRLAACAISLRLRRFDDTPARS